jgi:dipeptidyl aminopeptidase/acylaminoacyl peptidase
MKIHALLALLVSVVISGCSTLATHPSLRDGSTGAELLAPLVPVRSYVADWDGSGLYQISPDGQQLMWMARVGFGPGVFVKNLQTGQVQSRKTRGYPQWAQDSRHILLMADQAGDENAHIYQFDSQHLDAPGIDLTPFAGAASAIQTRIQDSADLLITSNRRDPKVFDLYRYTYATAEFKLLAQNPGDVARWLTTAKGQVLGRVRKQADRWVYEARDPSTSIETSTNYDNRFATVLAEPVEALRQAQGERRCVMNCENINNGWRAVFSASYFDSVQLLDVALDGSYVWALSNRGRDRQALVKIDLHSGQEAMVLSDPRVDVSHAWISQKTGLPLMASLEPDYQELKVFEPRWQAALQRVVGQGRARVELLSLSRDENLLTLSVTREDGGQHLLYNLVTDELTVLSQQSRSRIQALSPLPQQKPITFKSRDGIQLHGYLTLPQGSAGKNLPTVLYVHGGPWARDVWLGDRSPEFLVNRGYAVLQVNFRGSSGYGRAFQDLAVGEFAGKMHLDLIDGVDELIRQGIADPAKVAIMGASYGGYASLVGMTFTPERFACGISFVGMSDLASLLENAPLYWELGKPWWTRFVGDPSQPQQREVMTAKSPLFQADKVQKPLLILHGANDPRVKLDQSTRMVDALRAAGKEVDFVVFKGAGHGNQKWSDNLLYYRKTEDFLSRCLGGRSSGFDWYQLGSWAF